MEEIRQKLEEIRFRLTQQKGRATTVLGPEYVGRLRSEGLTGLADALENNVAKAIRTNAELAETTLDEIITLLNINEPDPEPPAKVVNWPFRPDSMPWVREVDAYTITNPSSFGNLIHNAIQSGVNPWFEYDRYSSKYQEGVFPIRQAALVQSKRTTRLHQRLQQGVPLPDDLFISVGSDAHVAVYDTEKDIYVEMWQARRLPNGTVECNWGAVVENASQNPGIVQPVNGEMWGATATSLPVVAGVVYAQELAEGKIPHALAMALPGNICARWDTYVWPALRSDGNGPQSAIPQGTRLKLPEDIQINSSWPPILKMLVEAARDYGCIVRDQAGSVNFYGNIGDNFRPYFGGQEPWNFMPQFPYRQLQAVTI